MNGLILNNYRLSNSEILQSVFVSEYGCRHWAQAKIEGQNKWGHRLIALLEFCPVLGWLATLVEACFVHCVLSPQVDEEPILESIQVLSPHVDEEPIPKPIQLFNSNQNFCNGSINKKEAREKIETLNKNPAEEIEFDPKEIEADNFELEGGTCTAMSLEFLNKYFQIKKAMREEQLPLTHENLKERIIQLKAEFATSSPKFRTRQAAYNAIRVKDCKRQLDYSLNKMQSIANDYSFQLHPVSEEISALKEESAKTGEEGAFLIRILRPDQNKKLEMYGHSMVYINEHGICVFYDCNCGAFDLGKSDHKRFVLNKFDECVTNCRVTRARFYRVSKKN